MSQLLCWRVLMPAMLALAAVSCKVLLLLLLWGFMSCKLLLLLLFMASCKRAVVCC
jgi:hypothetical protein